MEDFSKQQFNVTDEQLESMKDLKRTMDVYSAQLIELDTML